MLYHFIPAELTVFHSGLFATKEPIYTILVIVFSVPSGFNGFITAVFKR